MRRNIASAAFVLLWTISSGCGGHDPSSPANRAPVIESFQVFPNSIGKGDSAVAICLASDPDGDVLVYDWTTDYRLNVQGSPPYFHYIYNTDSPTRVFYPAGVDSPVDTAWIECGVRDQRGGETNALVYLVVRQDGSLETVSENRSAVTNPHR